MLDNLCGPVTGCGFTAWVYDYQTGIAAILALIAAIFAYKASIKQAKATLDAATRQIESNRQDVLDEQKRVEGQKREEVGQLLFNAIETITAPVWLMLVRFEADLDHNVVAGHPRFWPNNLNQLGDYADRAMQSVDGVLPSIRAQPLKVAYNSAVLLNAINNLCVVILDACRSWLDTPQDQKAEVIQQLFRYRVGILRNMDHARLETTNLLGRQVALTPEIREYVEKYVAAEANAVQQA